MHGRNVSATLIDMTDNDNDLIVMVTERFERRLSEDTGKLRVDMTSEFGKLRAEMATESGKLRAELATESGKLRAELATESGRLRAEMAAGFGGVRTEIAQLRAEMIDRNSHLLKWLLVFGATQTAAIAAVIRLWR